MFYGDTKKKSESYYTHSDKDLESMCLLCKNEDTKRLIGDDGLRIKDFYGEIKKNLDHNNFRAYHCMSCGNYWWHLTKAGIV